METEIREAEARRGRSGGRSARRALRSAPDLSMLPALRRNLPTCELLEPSQVERIDAASMAILEEVGVAFRDPVALADWRRGTFDVQAGYEIATTLSAVLHAGANYIWHSAGWNEAGMHCSVAKFVVDAEQCAMGYRMAEGVRWDDFDEALAAVRDVGPGGHYLGHPHTQANFERAFFMPKLFDNNSIEQWQAEGSQEITARALAHGSPALERVRGAPARSGGGRGVARLHRAAGAGDPGRGRAQQRVLVV